MKTNKINEDCLEEFEFKFTCCDQYVSMCWDWDNNELYVDARMVGFDMPKSLELVKKYNVVMANTWPCVSVKDACDLAPELKEKLIGLKKYFINNYDIWID